MTVKELKDILELYPDDRIVLVDGYEGGLQEPHNAGAVQVVYVGKRDYMGEYEPVKGGFYEGDLPKVRAFVLVRADPGDDS